MRLPMFPGHAKRMGKRGPQPHRSFIEVSYEASLGDGYRAAAERGRIGKR